MNFSEVIGTFVGFIFTVAVLSYILGDNAIFRLSIYIFIGVASGLAAVVAWYNVIWPQLISPIVFGDNNARLFAIVPLLLSSLLVLKVSPRLARFGNPAVAYLLGVGVASALGGALTGTLFPQFWSSINLFSADWLFQSGPQGYALGFSEGSAVWQFMKGGLILLGTVTTLVYFHYGARPGVLSEPQRGRFIEALAKIGQYFIAITFGAIFAGVYAAAMTALIERLGSIREFIIVLLQMQ